MSPMFDSRFWFVEFGPWVANSLWVWCALLAGLLVGLLFYKRFIGISSGKAFLLALLPFSVAALHSVRIAMFPGPSPMAYPELRLFSLPRSWATYALIFFTVALTAKLYLKWVHDRHVTEAERKPGMEGVRAWLGGGNLIVGFIISLLATASGFSFAGTLLLIVMALITYPLLSTIVQEQRLAPITSSREDLSAERDKVLKLLEDGKVTADEASELLNALGHTTAPPRASHVPLTPSRRAMFIGAALVLLGSLLPWATLPPGIRTVGPAFTTSGIGETYYEFARGMTIHWSSGWLILLMAVAAAAIPYLTPSWDRYTQRNWMLAILAIGAVILLSVVLQNHGNIGIGLMLIIAGYALECFGTFREYRTGPIESVP